MGQYPITAVCVCRLPIYAANPVKMTWAFLRSHDAQDTDNDLSLDYARIYLVNVTNTVQGGAATCRICPQGIRQDRSVGHCRGLVC